MPVPTHFFLRAAILGLCFTSTALAELRDQYSFPHAGRERTFEIATGEIEARDVQRRNRKVPMAGAANAEGIRKAAQRHALATGEEADLVLYETGRERNEYSRRVLRKEIAVKIRPGSDAAAIAARHGLVAKGEVENARGWHIFQSPTIGGTLEALDALKAEAGVEVVEPQLARQMKKRAIPNDTLFGNQWHLRNTGQSGSLAGTDVNVVNVWDTWKGTGVLIGIVDDGLQTNHPDLSTNVNTAIDHDWNDGTPNDPNPAVSVDFHGTSCAGVAAGRGFNGSGISGAAPEATLVGLRLIAALETDQDDADAMGWQKAAIHIKSNSWGPDDDGQTLEAPGPLMAAAFDDAIQTGRGGLGTIFVWAAGNGGEAADNSNYDGYANSIYTIAVAAVDNSGNQSSYSEPGANVAVCAPSDGGTLGITTTDLIGANGYNTSGGSLGADTNYTNDFGGTSSATPLAAGVIALVLQSKPTLGWRDVQEILIRSATKVDPTDTGWVNNAAGIHFNHKYGAGLVNAQAAVAMASTWTNLPAQQNVVSAQTGLNVAIADNNATGITRTFAVGGTALRAERVTVKVSITHADRGDLEIILTSPSGTQSRLAEVHDDLNPNYTNWTFSTVRSWGETSTGNWTLKIADRAAGQAGVLTSATLTVFGTPANAAPVVSAASVTPAGTTFFDQSLTVGGVTASDAESDAFTLGYQWEQSADSITYTPIAGATATTLALTSAQSGQYVRCAVTASSPGNPGAPFYTNAVLIHRRPVELSRHGQAYSFDSDLPASGAVGAARPVLINEFSQGTSGGKDWVELLTLETADLRGYTLNDATGPYCTFANIAAWSAVPAGTLIVIYNPADKDTTIPADDINPAGGSMIVGSNNATLFPGGTWGGLGTSGDNIQIKNTSAVLVDGISFGSGAAQVPALGSVAGGNAAAYTGGTNANAEIAGNWSIFGAASATPGVANGGANTTFATSLRAGAQYRLAAASDTVPGLTIDPVTGVLSGTPNVAGGGFFQIVIERAGTSTFTQSYPLLVADANGNYIIPAGKTWTMDQAATLTGNLTVLGSIDTAGNALSVNGTIAVGVGGTVANASGSIGYLQRSGTTLPGTTTLVSNLANDLLDIDGDGTSTILEFKLGMNPSEASVTGLPQVARVAGHLTLTYVTPVGATGVNGIVEVSGNLTTWNTGAGFTETMSDTTSGGLRTVVVRDLSTGAPRYIRFRAAR